MTSLLLRANQLARAEGIHQLQLSDEAWQRLLREWSSEGLLLVLWFLKDRIIAKRVMRNMSARAARMLVDDLVIRFGGQDPDTAPAALQAEALEELAAIVAIVIEAAGENE